MGSIKKLLIAAGIGVGMTLAGQEALKNKFLAEADRIESAKEVLQNQERYPGPTVRAFTRISADSASKVLRRASERQLTGEEIEFLIIVDKQLGEISNYLEHTINPEDNVGMGATGKVQAAKEGLDRVLRSQTRK